MRVAVIGAGVIGLTSALTALEAGHRVDIYADRAPQETTSARAAANFKLTEVADNELTHRLLRVGWSALQRIERESPESGVRMHTHWEASSSPLRKAAHLELVQDVEEVRGPNVPGGYAFAWRYRTFFMDVPRYLPWLVKRFASAGGLLHRAHFAQAADWSGIPADAVINCTGAGARDLCGDDAVVPIKGQVAIIERQPAMDWSISGDGFYVYPRGTDTVLGGTTEWNVETETVDAAATALILRGNRRILGHLTQDSPRTTGAGLRPYRHGGIRVEAEHLGSQVFVHNYGHGGAGFALAWGSAQEAVRLL